jgi:uncharacterized protein YoxC
MSDIFYPHEGKPVEERVERLEQALHELSKDLKRVDDHLEHLMHDTSDLLDELAKRIADVDHKLERIVMEERMIIDQRTDGLYQRLARLEGRPEDPR